MTIILIAVTKIQIIPEQATRPVFNPPAFDLPWGCKMMRQKSHRRYPAQAKSAVRGNEGFLSYTHVK
jgi:hypothetical protein